MEKILIVQVLNRANKTSKFPLTNEVTIVDLIDTSVSDTLKQVSISAIGRQVLFILLIITLNACKTQKAVNFKAMAGPLPICPSNQESKLFKKLNQSSLHHYSHCFEYSFEYLSKHQLINNKIVWLSEYKGTQATEYFLNEALEVLGSQKEIHLQLAKIYSTQKKWQQALQQINLAQVPVNAKIRLLIEGHLQSFSEGTNESLLPFILQGKDIDHAQVNKNIASGFQLQRVSDGNINVLNGEPSMATSTDGENIWLVWTDSGASTFINDSDFYWWKLKSIQSTDSGVSWSPATIDPLPGVTERFHFDPMTTYDQNSNTLYAGGSLKGFASVEGSSVEDDSMFLFKWNIDNGAQSGPFKRLINSPDKSWITSASNGDLYLAHHYGIDKSTDFGESFSRISTQNFYGAHPRTTAQGCLIVTDINTSINCDNGEITNYSTNFSSINLVFDANDTVAGTFRIAPFVLNAIHNNGDIYVVYIDYKNSISDQLTLFMANSSNNGQTWSNPWRITSDEDGNQFTPWIEIDDQGGIHVLYFDSRNASKPAQPDSATLDVYYTYSSDLGQSWQETRVTPNSFTTPELFWGSYFLTDYLSMSVANNHVYLAFPWSTEPNQMHLYFAKKTINTVDFIYANGFE